MTWSAYRAQCQWLVVYSKGKRFLQLECGGERGDMFEGAHYQIKTDFYPPMGLENWTSTLSLRKEWTHCFNSCVSLHLMHIYILNIASHYCYNIFRVFCWNPTSKMSQDQPLQLPWCSLLGCCSLFVSHSGWQHQLNTLILNVKMCFMFMHSSVSTPVKWASWYSKEPL